MALALVVLPRAVHPADVMKHVAALEAAGQGAPAIDALARARDAALTLEEEARLSLELAALCARNGRFIEAEAAVVRHLRLGNPGGAGGALLAGAVSLGLDRAHDALARFRLASTLAAPASRPARPNEQAAAAYGMTLAHELLGQSASADEAIGRAVTHDGGLALRKRICAGGDAVPVFGARQARFLCALTNLALALGPGDRLTAHAALRGLAGSFPDGLWRTALHARLRRSSAEATPNMVPAKHGARIAAMATVDADGGLPAPLVDAAVGAAMRRHGGTLARCLADSEIQGVARLRLRVAIAVDGKVQAAALVPGAASGGPQPYDGATSTAAACLTEFISLRVAFPPAPLPEPTTAQIEFVLIGGK